MNGINYPISEDLTKHAQENGADDELILILEELQEDYETPAEVIKAIGQIEQQILTIDSINQKIPHRILRDFAVITV